MTFADLDARGVAGKYIIRAEDAKPVALTLNADPKVKSGGTFIRTVDGINAKGTWDVNVKGDGILELRQDGGFVQRWKTVNVLFPEGISGTTLVGNEGGPSSLYKPVPAHATTWNAYGVEASEQ